MLSRHAKPAVGGGGGHLAMYLYNEVEGGRLGTNSIASEELRCAGVEDDAGGPSFLAVVVVLFPSEYCRWRAAVRYYPMVGRAWILDAGFIVRPHESSRLEASLPDPIHGGLGGS